MVKSNFGKKFISSYSLQTISPSSQEVRAVIQDRKLEAGAHAEDREECCLLDFSSQLSQPDFYSSQHQQPTDGTTHNEVDPLHPSQPPKYTTGLPTWQSDGSMFSIEVPFPKRQELVSSGHKSSQYGLLVQFLVQLTDTKFLAGLDEPWVASVLCFTVLPVPSPRNIILWCPLYLIHNFLFQSLQRIQSKTVSKHRLWQAVDDQ